MENSAHKMEQRAPAEELLCLVGEILGSCGMGEDDAKLLADSLVEADLAGTHSHGVLRVPEYVKKLTRDGVNPRGQPHVVRDEGACLVVDGDNSMGQIGAHFAMQRAIVGRALVVAMPIISEARACRA
jgi:LDH2 family malate/lactate/ureidoglycolate dehydrogenase